MKLTIQRFIHVLLIVSLLSISFILFSSSVFAAGNSKTSPSTTESVDRMMAGLSDEQVRQMLIAELSKDAEDEPLIDRHTMGPAGIFHRLLKKLSSEHLETEGQLEVLWAGIPNVLPDLYKVFITL